MNLPIQDRTAQSFQSKLTVMIVDDLPGTRSLLISMLRDFGYENFVEAVNGKDALQKLSEQKVSFIISDNIMKDMTGIDLLKHLRENSNFSNIPFLMMSAQSDINILNQSRKYGASDFIAKPVSFVSFENKIKKVESLLGG
jgi:CheY-like chemotaxis protein